MAAIPQTSSRRPRVETISDGDYTPAAPVVVDDSVLVRIPQAILRRPHGKYAAILRRSGNPTVSDPGRYEAPAVHAMIVVMTANPRNDDVAPAVPVKEPSLLREFTRS